MTDRPRYDLDEEMSDAENAASDLKEQIARIRRHVVDLKDKLERPEAHDRDDNAR